MKEPVASQGPSGPANIPVFRSQRAVARLPHEEGSIQIETVKDQLPRILQRIVSPAGGTAELQAVRARGLGAMTLSFFCLSIHSRQ